VAEAEQEEFPLEGVLAAVAVAAATAMEEMEKRTLVVAVEELDTVVVCMPQDQLLAVLES